MQINTEIFSNGENQISKKPFKKPTVGKIE